MEREKKMACLRDKNKQSKIIMNNIMKIVKTKILSMLSDKCFLKLQYFNEFGRYLDLKTPKTFNEKINFLKIHQTDKLFSDLADKYLVRDYVKNKIGERVLPKLYRHGKNSNEIPFEQLPNEFVMKCNHGCGFNIIVKNKEDLDVSNSKKKLNNRLLQDMSEIGRELQYKNIDRQIIIEELVKDNEQQTLNDYKIFCFDGEPNFIQVDIGRYSDHKRVLYDIGRNRLDFCIGRYPSYEGELSMPDDLKTMVKYAKSLSQGFPFVRVDFYYANNNIYFGEMTFTPCNGYGHFRPSHEELDKKYGKMIKL